MMFLELNSLFEKKRKPLQIPASARENYLIWKELRKEFEEYSEIEVFIAGYMIGTNPSLRDRFIRERRFRHIMEIDIQKKEQFNKRC